MAARLGYDMQLKELKNQMLLLGSMVEDVIQETIGALTCQDTKRPGKLPRVMRKLMSR